MEATGGQVEPPDAVRGDESATMCLAAATLARALADLEANVWESGGRNAGPRIRAMLGLVGCVPPANWCAAAVSTWIAEAAAELGVEAPCCSAGARALGAQLRTLGRWVDRVDVRPEHLIPGSVLVWARGDLHDPAEWRGHTGLLEGADGQELHTVEGNSGPAGDRVARMVRRLDDPALLGLGLLSMPATSEQTIEPGAWAECERLMRLGVEVMLGDPRDPLEGFDERHGG